MGKFKSVIHLDTKGLKSIQTELKKLDKTEIEFGWVDGKTHFSKTATGKTSKMTYATLAYFNEKGHYAKGFINPPKYVPARPYFQQSVMNTPFLRGDMKKVFDMLFRGFRYTEAMKFMGQDLEDNVKKSIGKQNFSPNKPSTIKLKGNSIQWVDSGKLINNVSYKVVYKRAGVS